MKEIPTLYMPIGAPGSGKSFLAKHLVTHRVIAPGCVISSDVLREQLLNDVTNQKFNHDIFKVAAMMANVSLKAGQDVYFDATNAVAKNIKNVFRFFHNTEFNLTFIQMEASLEKCLTRNAERARVVPEDAVERIYAATQNLDLEAIALPEGCLELNIWAETEAYWKFPFYTGTTEQEPV